jgi:hypothetical protein
LRHTPTAIRKLCGQVACGPSGVVAQSKARNLSAISLSRIIKASEEWLDLSMQFPSLDVGVIAADENANWL